ncbi:StAR-related lipid transfer protein 13 [Labeo rohita]|uniref:StAR-related lipid transfer protein 13 n=1 Tax=Labeo rohita TaxID=84645 RepID=A0ABQ8MAV3_LABRO|nr:StAR-related lipid transfer protein 13 [Labeo rohita]
MDAVLTDLIDESMDSECFGSMTLETQDIYLRLDSHRRRSGLRLARIIARQQLLKRISQEVNKNAVCGSFSLGWNLLTYTHFLSLTRLQECLDCMLVILSSGSWRSGRLQSCGEISGLSSHDCGMWMHIILKDIFTSIC